MHLLLILSEKIFFDLHNYTHTKISIIVMQAESIYKFAAFITFHETIYVNFTIFCRAVHFHNDRVLYHNENAINN